MERFRDLQHQNNRLPFKAEESRLGREAIETAYALKQLVQPGVRVFFYLEDRERVGQPARGSPPSRFALQRATFARGQHELAGEANRSSLMNTGERRLASQSGTVAWGN